MWKELERESEESRNMYDEDTQLKMETTAVTSS
jgi:hypothetical protein